MARTVETARRPGGAPVPGQPANFDPVGEAKTLLRTTRAGALATIDNATGAPFASLVAVATAPDGSPLILMSTLSVHTRNIMADARASLLMARGGKGDPLAHPRLTVSGRVVRDDDQRLLGRYLARHVKARLYAGFGDFGLYRMVIEGGHLNGGYARAAGIGADELVTHMAGADDLLATEASAIAHMNDDHADATRLYATRLLGLRAGKWRVTGIDPEGMDLALGDDAARLPFPSRVQDGAALRKVLKELADRARLV